jgi:small subunit ribosomal protein S20
MAKLKTGRHTSALKKYRQSEKRAEANQTIKSKIRTYVKKIETAVQNKDSESAKTLVKAAFSEWDKAARKNIIHKNAASNQKARLSRLVKSISA